jgi:hypothetical protein
MEMVVLVRERGLGVVRDLVVGAVKKAPAEARKKGGGEWVGSGWIESVDALGCLKTVSTVDGGEKEEVEGGAKLRKCSRAIARQDNFSAVFPDDSAAPATGLSTSAAKAQAPATSIPCA